MTPNPSQPKTPRVSKWQAAQNSAEGMRLKKDRHGLPYAAGNRHERRKLVARQRGAYIRDVKRNAEFDKEFRKDAIAARVERKQGAAHARAVARKAATGAQ